MFNTFLLSLLFLIISILDIIITHTNADILYLFNEMLPHRHSWKSIAKLRPGYYSYIQFTSMHYVSSRLMAFPSNCANCKTDPSLLCFLCDYNVLVLLMMSWLVGVALYINKKHDWAMCNMHLSNQLANCKSFVFLNYENYELWKYSVTCKYLRKFIRLKNQFKI